MSGAGLTYSYHYDAFNRMSSFGNGAGGTTTYSYNALGQRTSKSGPSGTFGYLYGPNGLLLSETAQNGTVIGSDYVWLNGQPIGLMRGCSIYFIHDDHIGRPDTVTNASGNIVWQAANLASDRTVTTNTIGGLNLFLPGQYYDAETGLYYNNARYYNAQMARYMESDPIGLAGGLNTYLYALGNPIGIIDPTGLDSVFDSGLYLSPSSIGGFVGAGAAGFLSYVGATSIEAVGAAGSFGGAAAVVTVAWNVGVGIGAFSYNAILSPAYIETTAYVAKLQQRSPC